MRSVVGTVYALAAAFALALYAPAVLGQGDPDWLAVVRLQPRAEVAGPDIYLGDVARVETADEALREQLLSLVLGRAPLPGQRRELHTASVETRMRQQRLPVARIALESDAPEIVVSTRAAAVSGEAMADAARQFFMEYAAAELQRIGPGRLQLECAVPESVTTPDGSSSVQVVRASGSPPGALVAWVEVSVDGAPVRSVSVRCDSAVELEVLVAAAALKRHDGLEPGTFEVETRSFSALPREGLVPVDEPDRWRLTRPVAPGTALTFGMVEPVPVLHKGSAVTIVASSGGIIVTAPGIALADGAQDEVIKVENTLSRQVVRAVVVDSETVSALVH